MSIRATLALAAVAAAVYPALGVAQVAQTQPAAVVTPAPGQRQGHRHAGFMAAMRGISLSDQQKAQIKQLMTQYRQAHPKGSSPDRQARRQLHEQVLGVLTPQQRTQFNANLAQMRAQRRAQTSTQPGGPFAPSPTP